MIQCLPYKWCTISLSKQSTMPFLPWIASFSSGNSKLHDIQLHCVPVSNSFPCLVFFFLPSGFSFCFSLSLCISCSWTANFRMVIEWTNFFIHHEYLCFENTLTFKHICCFSVCVFILKLGLYLVIYPSFPLINLVPANSKSSDFFVI